MAMETRHCAPYSQSPPRVSSPDEPPGPYVRVPRRDLFVRSDLRMTVRTAELTVGRGVER